MISLKACFVRLNFSKKIVPIIKNQAVNLQTNVLMPRQRVYQFLVVLLLILPCCTFAQQQMPRIGQNSPHLPKSNENFLETQVAEWPHLALGVWASRNNRAPFASLPGASHPFTQPGFQIPPDVSSHLPFFCQRELEFEKTTSIPLRLRLGSLDYVNKLEGKK